MLFAFSTLTKVIFSQFIQPSVRQGCVHFLPGSWGHWPTVWQPGTSMQCSEVWSACAWIDPEGRTEQTPPPWYLPGKRCMFFYVNEHRYQILFPSDKQTRFQLKYANSCGQTPKHTHCVYRRGYPQSINLCCSAEQELEFLDNQM